MRMRAMGIVTEYLAKLIEKQVEENGIVVWYDPEKHYGEVARNLDRGQIGDSH